MKYLSFTKNMSFLAMFFLLLNANTLTAEELSEGANNPDGAESSGRWDHEDGDHHRDCGCDDCCAGPQGPSGPQGPAGTPGTFPVSGYIYVYRIGTETVPDDGAASWTNVGPALNISALVGSQTIVVANAGVYSITFTASQTAPSAWQIWVNNAPVAGTIYSTSVGGELVGQAILNLPANAGVQLRNVSNAPAILEAPLPGSVLASVLIERLQNP